MVLEVLQILVGNLTVLNKLHEARRDSKSFFLGVSSKWLMLKSPHSIISADNLNILFNIDSNCFKKKLIFQPLLQQWDSGDDKCYCKFWHFPFPFNKHGHEACNQLMLVFCCLRLRAICSGALNVWTLPFWYITDWRICYLTMSVLMLIMLFFLKQNEIFSQDPCHWGCSTYIQMHCECSFAFYKNV